MSSPQSLSPVTITYTIDREVVQRRARLGGLAANALRDRGEALAHARSAFERRFSTPEERQAYFQRLSASGVAARRKGMDAVETGGAQ